MGERGYSLLEVMISMVVLAIAFLALVATQLGTLNGYVSARDGLQAAELARRTSELLRLQGSQWVYNLDVDPDPSAERFTFDPEPLFNSTEPMPFDEADPIGAILAADTAWVALVETPVDERFMRNNLNPLQVGKYCIYARGAEMNSTFSRGASGPGGTTVAIPVMSGIRVQVAIVYPGPRAVLQDCTLGTTVTEVLLDDVGDPNAADPSPAMELEGLRGSYSATVITRRAHLTNEAALGAQ